MNSPERHAFIALAELEPRIPIDRCRTPKRESVLMIAPTLVLAASVFVGDTTDAGPPPLEGMRVISQGASTEHAMLRDGLWPRPNITPAAFETTIALYKPATVFTDFLRSRFAEYRDQIEPLAADFRSLHLDSDDARRIKELGAELVRAPNEEWLMYPGVDSPTADPGWIAAEDDPRWNELADLRRRLAIRRFALWARLRSANAAFLHEAAELASQHEVRWSEEFVSRLIFESLRETLWSVRDGRLPEPADILDIAPPLPGVADSAANGPWLSLDDSVGSESSIVALRAATWHAVIVHDAAILPHVWRSLMKLPSHRSFSGLGALPSASEIERADSGLVRRWEHRIECVRLALASLVESVPELEPRLRAMAHETAALRHVSLLTGAPETRAWAVRIHDWSDAEPSVASWNPDLIDEAVVELSALNTRHAENLLDLTILRGAAVARAPAGSSAAVRRASDAIRRAVSEYESAASAILAIYGRRISGSSHVSFEQTMHESLIGQRPLAAR